MAVININHMKSGGQLNNCVSLNVKMCISTFCQVKLIHGACRCQGYIWFFSLFVIFLIKSSNLAFQHLDP